MFAHMSPEDDSFGETVSTLKFAQRVSTVELGAARSKRESSEVMQLREQVELSTYIAHICLNQVPSTDSLYNLLG